MRYRWMVLFILLVLTGCAEDPLLYTHKTVIDIPANPMLECISDFTEMEEVRREEVAKRGRSVNRSYGNGLAGHVWMKHWSPMRAYEEWKEKK